MRGTILSIIVLVAFLAPLAAQAAAPQGGEPHVAILGVGMASAHALRIEIATSGLDTRGTEPPTVELAVWLDGVPARATLPLIHMPPRFAMDLDLPAGIVRAGGVSVGTFPPLLPFEENMRFPVEVTVRHGSRVASARREATILLPTVIVAGYLSAPGEPDWSVIAAFSRYGYKDDGTSPSLFWFAYPSRQMTFEESAQALAAYVRRVVLPANYASRINVVGYSLGGLMARWNIAYNIDGWATLVNRLVLVGVPNEGSVMAYLGHHAPSFLPFSQAGHSPLVRAITPTFPFWRASATQPWSTPPDGGNTLLAQLNTRPIPSGIRLYIFYGSHSAQNPAGPQTAAGVTGLLPGADLSYEDGDGVVLAASAEGLPIHGTGGVADLANRAVLRVNLGAVYHTQLLEAGSQRIAGALLDAFRNTVDEAPQANSH